MRELKNEEYDITSSEYSWEVSNCKVGTANHLWSSEYRNENSSILRWRHALREMLRRFMVHSFYS